MLARLCDRAIYLAHGSLRVEGPFAEVQRQYLTEVAAADRSQVVHARAERGAAAPRFSIVIPTYQRMEVVVGSVRALAAQRDAGPFEVIVVVDGSTDGSAGALRALDVPFPLTVLEQGNRGRAVACNRGAAAAGGELLLILDDDMEAHPRLLAEHDRSHRDGADVVLGHIPCTPTRRRASSARVSARGPTSVPRRSKSRAGRLVWRISSPARSGFAREVFMRLGGFDTTFTRDGSFGGEDLDLGRRLVAGGCRVVFNPAAVSRQRIVTPRQYLRQWRQAGGADVRLARKYPDEAERVFSTAASARRTAWHGAGCAGLRASSFSCSLA